MKGKHHLRFGGEPSDDQRYSWNSLRREGLSKIILSPRNVANSSKLIVCLVSFEMETILFLMPFTIVSILRNPEESSNRTDIESDKIFMQNFSFAFRRGSVFRPEIVFELFSNCRYTKSNCATDVTREFFESHVASHCLSKNYRRAFNIAFDTNDFQLFITINKPH
jgi:hypothetical protein